jgi:hypothetical protein
MSMTKEEALTELATITSALTEYYKGQQRTQLVVWSAGIKREYHFSDPAKLLEYLIARRNELQAIISSFSTPTELLKSFNNNANIPMRFRRAY